MARRHGKHQRAQYRRGVKLGKGEPTKTILDDGLVVCPVCLRGVTLAPSGHLREHNAPDRIKCPNRTPPGNLRDRIAVVQTVHGAHGEELYRREEPSRLTDGTPSSVPTGRCHDCDKPVPGSRRLCGACLVKRGNV